MTYYLLRENRDKSITVSKWEGGTQPTQVYTVRLDRSDHHTCNCPSGTYNRYCKHSDFVRSWIKMNRPEGLEFT